MVNVGGQSAFVSGVNGTVTLNGNVYVAAKTFSAKWGWKQEEEGVVGTSYPLINTAIFHGEIDMEIVYSTENTAANEQFAKLTKPGATNQVVGLNLVWTGKDISSVTRTFTLTATFYPQQTEMDYNGPSVVKAKISGVLASDPALS